MLTKEQKLVLKEIFKSPIENIAVWGGGTALSEIYLHHRKSEDIDIILFDLPPVDVLTTLSNQIKKSLGAKNKKSFSRMNRFQYVFELSDSDQLKLEFVYYPFPKIGKVMEVSGFKVESLLDIAISKTLLAYQRSEVKDAFDLFIILQDKKFTFEKLISGVKEKFEEQIDPAILISRLTKSLENFDYLKPLLTRKYSKKEIADFFQKLFDEYLRKQKL
ncbi:MAG: nucleotidyl transferase AbiEii/AbiGii toxin family protein [Candidatus Berkelbacteria bacterium]|nr:nucleotidyl transferase AbiEii/AbiGii toxin family protein [Candidatus Berkelbacteria bacterium]